SITYSWPLNANLAFDPFHHIVREYLQTVKNRQINLNLLGQQGKFGTAEDNAFSAGMGQLLRRRIETIDVLRRDILCLDCPNYFKHFILLLWMHDSQLELGAA